MTGNQEATVGAETYGAAGLKLLVGDSCHRFDGLNDLFGRRDISFLERGHRLRIDGLNKRRLLGSIRGVSRSGLQGAQFVTLCRLDDPDRRSAGSGHRYEAAVAI